MKNHVVSNKQCQGIWCGFPVVPWGSSVEIEIPFSLLPWGATNFDVGSAGQRSSKRGVVSLLLPYLHALINVKDVSLV